ncbi:MAG: hypothetical protein V1820_06640 [archaeon]
MQLPNSPTPDYTAMCMPSSGGGTVMFWPANIPVACDGIEYTTPGCGDNCACCVSGGAIDAPGGATGTCMVGPGCTIHVEKCEEGLLGTGAYCTSVTGTVSTCSTGAAYAAAPGALGGSCSPTVQCRGTGICTPLPSGLKVCLAPGTAVPSGACTGADQTCYPNNLISGTWSPCVYSVTGAGAIVEGDCVDASVRAEQESECGIGKSPDGNWACVLLTGTHLTGTPIHRTLTNNDLVVESPGICSADYVCMEGTCKSGAGVERICSETEPGAGDFDDSCKKDPFDANAAFGEIEPSLSACGNSDLQCYERTNPNCQASGDNGGGNGWGNGDNGDGDEEECEGEDCGGDEYTPAGCESDATVTRICVDLETSLAHRDETGMYYVNPDDNNRLYSEDWFKPCTLEDTCCPNHELCYAPLDQLLLCKSADGKERKCMTLEASNQEVANGWVETSLPCHSDDSCCWRGVPICMEKSMGNPIEISVKPSTTDKRLKTGCKVTVNVTQKTGASAYQNENLVVNNTDKGITTNIPAVKTLAQNAALPFYWTWNVSVPNNGTYNFSFLSGTAIINWTQYTASSTVAITCPVDVPALPAVNISVTPATPNKELKTGCKVLVNVTQLTGTVAYSSESLVVKYAGTTGVPVTKNFTQNAVAPFYWTWNLTIASDGPYHFSFLNGSTLVNWTTYTALSTGAWNCLTDLPAVNISVKPATPDKKLTTGCIATINVTQLTGTTPYQTPRLTMKHADTTEIPVTANLTQDAVAPFYWIWRAPVAKEGKYNFSFLNGSTLVNWTNYTALSAVALTCPGENCTEICINSTAATPVKLGCGMASCSKLKMAFNKTCTEGICGLTTVTYCANDSSCIPIVTGNWSTINLGGTANFNVSLGANVSNYSGAVTKIGFFIDGLKVGEDSGTPYSATVGLYVAGTTHKYYATAVTPDGNFSSVNYTIEIPHTIPTPTPVPTPTPENQTANCTQYFECFYGFTNCSLGTVYVASAKLGSRIELKANSSGGISFYPPFAGNHSIQAVCGDRASEVKTLEVAATSFTVSVVGGNCTIPDRNNCTLVMNSSKAVPLDFFILGNASKGLAFSELRREGSGWTGNRTISFSNISYRGTGPHEVSVFIYPRDAYLSVPAAFVKAIYIGKVQ